MKHQKSSLVNTVLDFYDIDFKQYVHVHTCTYVLVPYFTNNFMYFYRF